MGMWLPKILPCSKHEVSCETTGIYTKNVKPRATVLRGGDPCSYRGSRGHILPYRVIQAWRSYITDRSLGRIFHNTRTHRSPLFSKHSDVMEKYTHQRGDGFASLNSDFQHATGWREPRVSLGFLRSHALCLGGHGTYGL